MQLHDAIQMYALAGKTAVVTGAASGIGLGMARAFAEADMSLVIADIEAKRLAEVVEQFRSEDQAVLGVVTDVSDAAQVQALADAAVAEFGAVHVVANNAGVGVGGAVDTMSLDDWRWILDVNLWGVIHGIRTFLPLLKAQGEGHISATSSVAGLVGGPMLGAYHASKHAVVGLMDSVRVELELAKSSVTASVLCPGPVDTNVTRSVRNRPGHMTSHPSTESEDRFWSRLVDTLASGMAADEVGRLVLDAVTHERFWILTDPSEHIDIVETRLAEIRDDHVHRNR